ncbi:RNA polymerase sigma-H factor [Lysinibacillus sphaericus]|nr:RNA polymerase sigma-H factor [Lysinibacillus sphaericus]
MFKNSIVQVTQDFERFNDEELIEMVHQGNTDALDFLITKYRLLVRAKARSYF